MVHYNPGLDADMEELHAIPPAPNDTDDVEIDEAVIIEAVAAVKSAYTAVTDVLKPNVVILDNAAGESIFRTKSLLSNIRDSDLVIFEGVNRRGASIRTTTVGTTIFGDVYHSYLSIGNILSFGRVVDDCHSVKYHKEGDYFSVQPNAEGQVYIFSRHPEANLYTCDMGATSEHVLTVGVQTVSENMNKYTKREIRQARLAREYLRRSNYNWTEGQLIKQLAAGKIKNAEISVQDVLRAHDIWGKCIGTLKGKTTARKSPTVTFEPIPRDPTIQRDQVCNVDIMFYNSRPYLLAKINPLEYPIAKRLRGGLKNKYELLKALQSIISTVDNTGLRTVLVRCDGESAVASDYVRTKLGVEIDTSAADEAVTVIERLIRTIKERLRAVENTLPFDLCEQLEDWLLQATIYFLGAMPTANSLDMRSPREKLMQVLLDAKTDLRFGFGDYVQIADNETDNSMAERTRGAIALMPAGNREGSWWFYVLKTRKPVKRNTATILPMPDEVIALLNSFAERDRKGRKRTRGHIDIGTWRTFMEEDSDDGDTTSQGPSDPSDDIDIEYSLPERVQPQRGVEHHGDLDYEANGEDDDHPFTADDDSNNEPQGQANARGVHEDIFGPDSDAEEEATGDINRDLQEYTEPAATQTWQGTNEPSQEQGEQLPFPDLQQGNTAPLDYGVRESPGIVNSSGDAEDVHPSDPGISQQSGDDGEVRTYNLRGNRAQPGRWRGVAFTKKAERRTAHEAGVRRKFNSARNAFLRRTFGLHLSVRQAINKLGVEAIRSVVKEMIQLVGQGTFEGVNVDELSEEQLRLIITSSTFLKEKFHADGLFDKLKARLVAGGHLQDRTIYDESTSPTASTTSVFIAATLAANEGRAVATVDVPGAFLHSKMPDDSPPVLMRLNKFETKVLVKVEPSFAEYVRPNGTCVVKLKRALYGCVQSARLWYKKVSSDLITLGYAKNRVDECVFNRTEADGSQSTLVLHVDDFFISAKTEDHVSKVIEDIEALYPSLSVKRGRVLDYLGMQFDFREAGKCRVTMSGYINELLGACDHIPGVAKTPAGSDLFNISDGSVKLDKENKDYFHSLTAKFLYLGKRVRPDLLTAISFLARRVNEPTEQDLRKLFRVVRYLRSTRDKGIVLEANKALAVYAWVDASYGVHADFKSHTGCVIGIGKGPVYAKSTTQKLNTKSSSEAELVGVSDSAGQVIWTRNFLIQQGYDLGPATIYQDNQSAIALVRNGKSNSDRTRHIAIRFFFIADRVESKEIAIEYLRTGDMLADILTKPLQGQLFVRLRDELLNWYE